VQSSTALTAARIPMVESAIGRMPTSTDFAFAIVSIVGRSGNILIIRVVGSPVRKAP
jgi:hypothetical protein